MQKLEDAVIHMQKNFNEVEFLFNKEECITEINSINSEEPFSDNAISFLDALSKLLLEDKNTKFYPDVATFAFYCRKANIIKLKEKYRDKEDLRLGRGLVFHIAPSNVPVNFAYSLLCGILSGNTNIVRVPSKDFEQINIIVNAFNYLKNNDKFLEFSSRQILVRYPRQSNATAYFSSICDTRVIWGGDQTISEIRMNKIPARSFDITFADRYSLCVINADAYVDNSNPQQIAQAFYNDTYLFDQNACTSPHLVVWLGDKVNVDNAKNIFWNSLYFLVKKRDEVQPVIAVDKLTALYTQAILSEGVRKVDSQDNLLWRVNNDELDKNIDEYRCSSGYFSEYHAKSIKELSTIINSKYQTLAYYGIDRTQLLEFMKVCKPFGIDRIVPIGKTTDFSIIWDGYDLIKTLSRRVEIL